MRRGLPKIWQEKTQKSVPNGERVERQSYGLCLFLVSGSNKSSLLPASGLSVQCIYAESKLHKG